MHVLLGTQHRARGQTRRKRLRCGRSHICPFNFKLQTHSHLIPPPASEDEGLNAFAVVTLGPSPGAVYGDARHVRHASAASGVGGGGGADRVIGGARVVMGNTGSAGSSAGAVCASVANAVFATEPRVNSRSPAWHAAAPAALITTRESDRLRIEIRHDPSASRALSDEAVRALGAGEGTPRYQADGRGGGVEVRGGHLRVEGGPDYAMMTGIG